MISKLPLLVLRWIVLGYCQIVSCEINAQNLMLSCVLGLIKKALFRVLEMCVDILIDVNFVLMLFFLSSLLFKFIYLLPLFELFGSENVPIRTLMESWKLDEKMERLMHPEVHGQRQTISFFAVWYSSFYLWSQYFSFSQFMVNCLARTFPRLNIFWPVREGKRFWRVQWPYQIYFRKAHGYSSQIYIQHRCPDDGSNWKLNPFASPVSRSCSVLVRRSLLSLFESALSWQFYNQDSWTFISQ